MRFIQNFIAGVETSRKVDFLNELKIMEPLYFKVLKEPFTFITLFENCPATVGKNYRVTDKLLRLDAIYTNSNPKGYPSIKEITDFANEIEFNDNYSRMTLYYLLMYNLLTEENYILNKDNKELIEKNGLYFEKE